MEVFIGENSFALEQALSDRKAEFGGAVEQFDGAELSSADLLDIFAGQTLFADKRLVIIKEPSECQELWSQLEKWVAMVPETTRIILVEPKPDKRTATYKWLQKHAAVRSFDALTGRDRQKLSGWLATYAAQKGVRLSPMQRDRLVERAGGDQWRLHHAVEKLSLMPAVTDELIEEVLPAETTENVFTLLETALSGDAAGLQAKIAVLRRTEDAYRVFGLLSSQVLQLNLLVHAGGQVQRVAQDAGLRPFMLERLAAFAARLSTDTVRGMVQLFAKSDRRLKSTDAEPWLVVETTLQAIAQKA
jgi:DNA polymerase III delta subunit